MVFLGGLFFLSVPPPSIFKLTLKLHIKKHTLVHQFNNHIDQRPARQQICLVLLPLSTSTTFYTSF